MALQMLTPPLAEPVSLADAKNHLRVDASEEDAFIDSLALTARLQIEAAMGLALINQSWRLTLDCWPFDGTLSLPLRPLRGIGEIRIHDRDGNAAIVDPLVYSVDAVSTVGRLSPRSGYWPQPGVGQNGIEIDFDAGFGATGADVPAPIRQAMLLLVGHWYENREPAQVGTLAAQIPQDVSSLLAPYVVTKL